MKVRELLNNIKTANKKVLIVGLGISGVESALFLLNLGIKVVCVEKSNEKKYQQNLKWPEKIEFLTKKGAELHFEIDGHAVNPYLNDVGLAVLSPGVSLESSIVGALKLANVPMIGELELGIEYSGLCSVVVTGSNGKSTTVSLITHILNSSGKKAILCGNVGVPVVAQLGTDNSADSILIVEASSYQLETCTMLKPNIGVLLNLSENHLERHGTLSRYLGIKARIFSQQNAEDLAILNADDEMVSSLESNLHSKVLNFGTGESCNARIEYSPTDNVDRIVFDDSSLDLSSCKLYGLHNRSNVAVAALVARELGTSDADIINAVNSFSTLEHRLELVPNNLDRVIINDSKSTTVAACRAAVLATVERYREGKLTIMIGGLAKAGSWKPVIQEFLHFKERLNAVICFGEDGRMLSVLCQDIDMPFLVEAKVETALDQAIESSTSGDIILFSPGCASFDEFRDFEERGNMFKSYVGSI